MRILKTHKQQSTKIIDGNTEISRAFVKKKGQSEIHIGCSAAHGYVESLQKKSAVYH